MCIMIIFLVDQLFSLKKLSYDLRQIKKMIVWFSPEELLFITFDLNILVTMDQNVLPITFYSQL